MKISGRSDIALALVMKELTVNTHGIRTFLAYIHGRPIYGHDDRFSLIARLLLILKGYT